MPAGQLRHRVDVVRQVETPDGRGGSTTSEQVIVADWPAAIEPAAPQWRIARIVGGAVDERASVLITCRYHAGITEDVEILWKARGVRFHTRGIEDVNGQARWMRIAADRIVS